MRLGKGVALVAAALFGAVVGVLPAAASSEPPPVEAENGPGYYEHSWKPSSVTVSEGVALTISNKTEVPHGVEWRPGDPEKPTCTAGVRVAETATPSGTNWTGSCTFRKPGVYVFWCTVHGSAMSATVTVQPAGTTTGTTPGTTPGGTTGTTPGGTTGTTPAGGGGGGGTTISLPVSPPAAAAVTAVKLRSQQHGPAVRGSLDVSGAGARAHLEVDLLAKRASLASARSSFLRVGRLVRSAVEPGTVTFRVPLSASGRRVLARAGRLVLVVEITLTPRAGNAVVIKRTVTLRA